MTHHAHWRDVSLGHFANYRYRSSAMSSNIFYTGTYVNNASSLLVDVPSVDVPSGSISFAKCYTTFKHDMLGAGWVISCGNMDLFISEDIPKFKLE